MNNTVSITISLTGDQTDLDDFINGLLNQSLERIQQRAMAFDLEMTFSGAGLKAEVSGVDNISVGGSITGTNVNIGSGSQTFQSSESHVQASGNASVNTRHEQTSIVQNGGQQQVGRVEGDIYIGFNK